MWLIYVSNVSKKGLSAVYDSCGAAMRESLVNGLVQTLLEGKKTTQVTADTELFTEGEFSKTPSGGQLSTYRELCSLASDLNQPDLVYKFMNLANHNSIWNSRKGAAFGFERLAAQAGAQLEPHLPEIVPKLYRYQHDPTPRIQESMTHIWGCLVKDTPKTTLKYYDQILADLSTNLISKVGCLKVF